MNFCKICKIEIKSFRTYCSNNCKFLDGEYNKSRVSKKKNDGLTKLKCIKCGWNSLDFLNKSGCITSHLKTHNIEDGDYLKYFEIIRLSKSDYWHCPKCNWKTLDIKNKSGCIISHLENIHNLSLNIIVNELIPDLNSKKIEKFKTQLFLEEDEKNRIKCEECGLFFKKLSQTHLKKHGLLPSQYKIKHGITNTASSYVSEIQSEHTFSHNFLSGSSCPAKSSSLEDDFAEKLNNFNIPYQTPFLFNGKKYDFYLPSLNSVVEIDGEAYHKDRLENLTIQTINGSVNDYIKNKKIQETNLFFYRIRYDKSKFSFNSELSLTEQLKLYSYEPKYSISYKQILSTKKYFNSFIKYKGKEKLKSYSKYLLKFIRTFQPTLPYPDLEENIVNIQNKIRDYDLNRIYNPVTKEFSNNTSTVGHNYLKHYFKSYWKSKFKNNLSPEKAWLDDKIMKEIIEYRIGCNNSNEIYDFSLYQLVKGLSARRVTVSFFKPLLAAAIYKHYIGNNSNPIVLDPCCGFGGRLLGFKSIYPKGTYIGCEPNIETYNELLELVKNAGWENVYISNRKFEQFTLNNYYDFDLIFTSIPYYDIEVYNNDITYKSFDEWRNTFIRSIELYNNSNCYINTTEGLSKQLGWQNIDSYIISTRSHFDKRDGNKKEVIIKL